MAGLQGTGTAGYWDERYETIGATAVSWFQGYPAMSMSLINSLSLPKDAPLVDVGGGASRLVDVLVGEGFTDVTVVDLSQRALDEATERIPGNRVAWVQADLRAWKPTGDFALWHDRAAYHFLTDPEDQRGYWETARQHVRPGGHVVIATFAPDGPEMCSGLPVQRYGPDQLAEAMGDGFTAVSASRDVHLTPSGGAQPFTWVLAVREG